MSRRNGGLEGQTSKADLKGKEKSVTGHHMLAT